ncbi:hypothetical protein F4813DRAFT_384538 [Daldinia decipiens]|uniref:uncharacterized protein n=1 Tax=Daldinia decipiens TaxID=326647 RepID=UPI0020C3EC3A|nr:uncharacterized protein F4813DRAFT_384538 [Daldinia decipiens]KAI1662963.1 hypothetical protein F4813DRAFT_384538 [Daldinia decipiens]
MFTENLSVGLGLVNGALGTVEDIVWAEGADYRTNAPEAIFVAFNRYSTPLEFCILLLLHGEAFSGPPLNHSQQPIIFIQH